MSSVTVVFAFNPAIIQVLATLLQRYFYIMLFNVNYPNFLPEFFQSMSFARLDFISMPLANLFENSVISTHQNFMIMGMDGVYLSNGGGLLIFSFISLAILCCLNYLAGLLPTGSRITSITKKIKNAIIWEGMCGFIISFTLELTLTSSL